MAAPPRCIRPSSPFLRRLTDACAWFRYIFERALGPSPRAQQHRKKLAWPSSPASNAWVRTAVSAICMAHLPAAVFTPPAPSFRVADNQRTLIPCCIDKLCHLPCAFSVNKHPWWRRRASRRDIRIARWRRQGAAHVARINRRAAPACSWCATGNVCRILSTTLQAYPGEDAKNVGRQISKAKTGGRSRVRLIAVLRRAVWRTAGEVRVSLGRWAVGGTSGGRDVIAEHAGTTPYNTRIHRASASQAPENALHYTRGAAFAPPWRRAKRRVTTYSGPAQQHLEDCARLLRAIEKDHRSSSSFRAGLWCVRLAWRDRARRSTVLNTVTFTPVAERDHI